jgi:replicative DNA helicase
MKTELFSQEIERACISASINYQKRLADILPVVTEDYFYFGPHKIIFSNIKNLALAGKAFDLVILTDKIKSFGLKTIEGLDIGDYLNSVSKLDAVEEESFLEYFKQLTKYYNAREIVSTAEKIEKFVSKNINTTSSELITGAERIFGEKINKYESDNEPKDFFADLEQKIELRGNEPTEDGIENPYPEMRRFFGNYLPGGLYIFAAPAKTGKSTLLQDIQNKISKPNECVTLYLDTELILEEEQNRYVAANAEINEYYIRTGKFRFDKNMTNGVRSLWPKVEQKKGCVYHLYVAGKPIDELLSICRRWYYKHVKKGVKMAIFLDYIKLTGEKISDSWKEYQVIGEKVDKLKQLAQALHLPVIAAVQMNAQQDVAMSNQIKWFCSMLGKLLKKEPNEIATYGDKFGTHKLTITESRNQGVDALGFNDLVKMPDGSFERMFVNLEFNNFNVREKGTLLDIAENMQGHFEHAEDGEKKKEGAEETYF